MEPEVSDHEVLGVERAHDLGQLLDTAAQAHGRRIGRRGDRRPEALEHGRDRVAVGALGRLYLERRAPDLGLERLRRPAGHDLAAVDDREVVGEHVGLLEVLRRQEDRDAVVARQARHLLPHVGAALRVEPGGRLVEEEDARVMHERERQVEPALHAARVAADLAVRRVGEADALEQRVAARAPLGLRHALERGLEAHVLAAGEQRVERRLLERRADLAPHRGAVLHDVAPGHARGARGGRQQRGEHQHGGRLAGAVGPEEAIDLAGLDPQVDAVDRPHGTLELAHEALDLDAVGEDLHG